MACNEEPPVVVTSSTTTTFLPLSEPPFGRPSIIFFAP